MGRDSAVLVSRSVDCGEGSVGEEASVSARLRFLDLCSGSVTTARGEPGCGCSMMCRVKSHGLVRNGGSAEHGFGERRRVLSRSSCGTRPDGYTKKKPRQRCLPGHRVEWPGTLSRRLPAAIGSRCDNGDETQKLSCWVGLGRGRDASPGRRDTGRMSIAATVRTSAVEDGVGKKGDDGPR